MDLQIKDKIAFISGSTAGIGFATAQALAAEGARVVINGRTQARVDEAVKAIGGNARGIAADLGTREGCNAVIAQLPHVDILVNNVGIFAPQNFEEITDADWLRFFETNVLSGVRLARAWMPGMRRQNWGRIVFISSESGVQIPVEMIHYGVTKTAQIAVARGLAETTIGSGVTVNTVLPGPTSSEGVGTFVQQMAEARGTDFATMEKEFFTSARPSSLLQRFATPEEVAAMIVYVCSAQASATNGAALRVDGGVVRAIL
ncbi:MAG: SDR family NAD(P)-dependent oxidoreductase [Thermoanaerobaculia bacterium]